MPTKKPTTLEEELESAQTSPVREHEFAVEAAPDLLPTEPAPPPKPEPARFTPAEWAERLGYRVKRDPRLPQSVDYDKPEHAAADALYGWTRHAYHYQGEAHRFVVTEEDYRAALRAAGQFPVEAPHAPAIPPSEVNRFKDFAPKARSPQENR